MIPTGNAAEALENSSPKDSSCAHLHSRKSAGGKWFLSTKLKMIAQAFLLSEQKLSRFSIYCEWRYLFASKKHSSSG
jgi:hypothetical protein